MIFQIRRKFFLYFLTVITPTALATFLFININVEQSKDEHMDYLNWVASIHKQQVEQLMLESITSLEILGLSLEEMMDSQDNRKNINQILKEATEVDPRYSGIYVLDTQGTAIYGTEETLMGYTLFSHDHVLSVLKTKHTTISDESIRLENGLDVLAVASPILNEDLGVKGIVIAHIRVDYLLNVMNILTPDQTIKFMNIHNKPILEMNMPSKPEGDLEWVTIPLDRLPWEINVQMKEQDISPLVGRFILMSVLTFVLINIFYIIIQYFLLLRRASLEKAQNEAQKLELVGTLAASTAHEIRNPLTGIKGLMQLLSEKYNTEEDQLYFSVIGQEINRINEIVSEFLILGKPAVLKTDRIDLRNILDELKPLIESEANLYNCIFTMSYPDDPLPILCVKDQLKQVILNITKNAFESMGDKGQVTIIAEMKNNQVVLTVSDTGIGMTTDELKQIFQPFYTSKDHGTGLGLVVCKRIIESFNGHISLTSLKHIGTRVTIHLPIT